MDLEIIGFDANAKLFFFKKRKEFHFTLDAKEKVKATLTRHPMPYQSHNESFHKHKNKEPPN